MKKIEAIIRSSKFEEVRDALAEIGVRFFTFKDVKGYGREGSPKIIYRGSTYDAGYIARVQLDILCEDEKAAQIVETLLVSARTGEVGDGKISVYAVEEVIRIRNGDRGAQAL